MNSLDIFSTQKVRYNGRYEFDAAYQQVFDFLENLRYDVWEKKHSVDRTNNKLNVRIEAQREINAMIRRRIIIKFQAYDWEEFQVETKDGRKSVCDGRLIISITGYADIDYRDIFTGSATSFSRRYGKACSKSILGRTTSPRSTRTVLSYAVR